MNKPAELPGLCRFISPHRGSQSNEDDEDSTYLMMRPVYTTEYAESVKPRHKVPEKVGSLDPLREAVAHRIHYQGKAMDLEGCSVCDILTKLTCCLIAGQSCAQAEANLFM